MSIGLAGDREHQAVRHFCIGTDVRILHTWYKENGATMRDLFEAPVSQTV